LNHYHDKSESRYAGLSSYSRIPGPPPEPRLLPNPFTDQHAEVVQYKRLHPDTAQLRAGEKYPVITPDRLPWDKRTEEIEDQDAETNGASGKTIPVAAAMALEAGAAPGAGLPGVMPWQHDYPSRIAGTTDKSMNLDVGAKRQQGDIFDDRPRAWESLDEKFSADSTGGLDLTPKSKNPNWSR
jgi:hypothetical protein